MSQKYGEQKQTTTPTTTKTNGTKPINRPSFTQHSNMHTHKPQIDNQWATLKQSMSKQIKPAHVQREKKRREKKRRAAKRRKGQKKERKRGRGDRTDSTEVAVSTG